MRFFLRLLAGAMSCVFAPAALGAAHGKDWLMSLFFFSVAAGCLYAAVTGFRAARRKWHRNASNADLRAKPRPHRETRSPGRPRGYVWNHDLEKRGCFIPLRRRKRPRHFEAGIRLPLRTHPPLLTPESQHVGTNIEPGRPRRNALLEPHCGEHPLVPQRLHHGPLVIGQEIPEIQNRRKAVCIDHLQPMVSAATD